MASPERSCARSAYRPGLGDSPKLALERRRDALARGVYPRDEPSRAARPGVSLKLTHCQERACTPTRATAARPSPSGPATPTSATPAGPGTNVSFQHVESRISGTTGHCLDVPDDHVLPGLWIQLLDCNQNVVAAALHDADRMLLAMPSLVTRAAIQRTRSAVVMLGGMSMTCCPTVAQVDRTTRSAAVWRSSTLAR